MIENAGVIHFDTSKTHKANARFRQRRRHKKYPRGTGRGPLLILIDSYGWLEYYFEGPLAEKYAKYIEETNEENYVTPTIVLYEVYKRIRSIQGEQSALEAYAQITRTKIVELTSQIAMEKQTEISLSTSLAMA